MRKDAEDIPDAAGKSMYPGGLTGIRKKSTPYVRKADAMPMHGDKVDRTIEILRQDGGKFYGKSPAEQKLKAAYGVDYVSIFIHVPKTAGTSLNKILSNNYSAEHVLDINAASVSKLGELNTDQKNSLRVIRGHITFGVDGFVDRNHLYLCVLRRPGPRIFSFFNFLKRSKTHRLHAHVSAPDFTFSDFLDFTYSDSGLLAEIDNGQVRRIANKMNPDRVADREMLFEATKNIREGNIFIGFTERFDEYVGELAELGVISNVSAVFENVSPFGISYEDAMESLGAGKREMLEEFTMWDDILYNACYGSKYGEIE